MYFVLENFYSANKLELRVEANISNGNYFEVFFPNKAVQIPIKKNQLHTYHFKGLPSILKTLRLDPTDIAGEKISITSVGIFKGETKIQHIDTTSSSKWTISGAEVLDTGNSSKLELLSQSTDPILMFNEPINLPNSIIFKWTFTEFILAAIILLMVLITLLNSPYKNIFLPYLGIGAGIFFSIMPFLVTFFFDTNGSPPIIKDSIGGSSFFNFSNSSAFQSFIFSFLVFIIILILAGIAIKRFVPISQRQPEYSIGKFHWSFTLVISLLLILVLFPDIRGIRSYLGNYFHVWHWDSNNLFAWKYLIYKGLIPYKDFWYPYGNLFYTDGPLINDRVVAYLNSLIIAIPLTYATFRLQKHNIASTVLVLLSLVILFHQGTIQSFGRYIHPLAASLVFTVALIDQSKTKAIIAGLLFSWMLWLEPSQWIYACFASCSVACFFLKSFWKNRLTYLRIAFTCGAPQLLFIAVYSIKLWHFEQLHEFIQFYSEMTALVSYSSVPFSLSSWFTLANFEGRLLLSFCFLSLVFIYLQIFQDLKDTLEVRTVCLLCIALLLICLFKQFARPDIAKQVLAFGIYGILMLFGYWLKGLSCRQKQLSFLLFGILMTFFIDQQRDFITNSYTRLISYPSNIRQFYSETADFEKLNKRVYSPEVIAFTNKDRNEIIRFIQDNVGPDESFFVFGDDSYLYVLNNQKMPRYISLYNTSIFRAQTQIVEYLKKEKPKYIFWDSNFITFDRVPNLARVPLLYDYIIANYRPKSSVWQYEFLTAKDPEIPIDLSYWTNKLNRTVDLGYIPGQVDLGRYTKCNDKLKEACVELLKIDLPSSFNKNEIIMDIALGENLFQIKFNRMINRNVYFIPLNRIWFWNVAKSISLNSQISTAGSEIKLDIISVQEPKFLY